jgi:hypothetical protein
MSNKMSLEKDAYLKFRRKFDGGEYKLQRFGQAFYNTFNLHRLSNQAVLRGLYELNGTDAERMIEEIFELN